METRKRKQLKDTRLERTSLLRRTEDSNGVLYKNDARDGQQEDGATFKNEAVFSINGMPYQVDSSIPLDTSLNTYIRTYANLRGTKSMCHEGGCGACVVNVTSTHPATHEKESYAVNSCLVPVLACHGWDITTVEGTGSKLKGYHKIQTRLTQFNGTQCGYCTPGMVMNMYSLLANKDKITMKEIENSFGGNICRCTGYRPILDAFKSLATDAPPELADKFQDIEELHKVKICQKNGLPCVGSCNLNGNDKNTVVSPLIHLQARGSEWYTVKSITEILAIFNKIGDASYMLVAGNTAQGVYHRKVEPQCYINVNEVDELKKITKKPALTLGGNVSLTEAMELFYKLPKEQPTKYSYTKVLADHIDLIANVPVRNIGTIAGNLSIKHENHEFPSDLFLILETVGAILTIVDQSGKETDVNLLTYLNLDMKHKVIKSVSLPALDDSYHFGSYKIMPRAQNAHAYVNAGFLFKLDKKNKGLIVEKPNIIIGGIHPKFLHASKTEEAIQGKNILQKDMLQNALKTLDSELEPDHILPDATPAYRKGLAKALLYKFILSLSPDTMSKSVKSGGQMLERPVSSGKQTFETEKSLWPLNQPVPKIEALVQCSGEAKYVNDTPTMPGELYAAFVTTTVGQGTIVKVNPTDALALKGVMSFIGPKDIPGKNSFTPPLIGLAENEEILCSGKVLFAGQPLGIIVAETQQLAQKATELVKVEYKDVKKPLTSIRDVLKSGDESRITVVGKIDPTDTEAKAQTKHVMKGSYDIGGQYHYTMEPQSCVCIPIEDGMDVFPASQWMDLTQVAIAGALSIPENSINVNVRRLGGAYGAKISRASQVSTACAIAAHILGKPVRFILSIEDNMKIMGKRFPCASDYEVGVDDEGVIKYMQATLYENTGCSTNESVIGYTVHHFTNCYDKKTWSVTGKSVRTDIASNTYCRAPGSTEGIAFIENIMEHIAQVLKKDPLEIRIKNMFKDNNPLPQLIKDIKVLAGFDERQLMVEEFNKENRWKKRGLAVVPMKYPFQYFGNFHAIVSIYAADGTVAVAHGGIECGQGINTKVLQVCAHILGIPMEMVSIKPSNNFTSPNGMVTGGSVASESCAYATMICCQELLKRMEPIKQKLEKPTWQTMVAEAHKENIDLCATYMFSTKDEVQSYSIWGVTVAEVEVDVLTGQQQILRVDLMEDAGNSLSPEIDIGQMEGAFVMGLGYWLMEYLTYHPDTGELLTNRTWNYKTPGVKDIPIDFRINFRRNAPNPSGVLRSKATGEPPLCMSCVVLFALRNALNSARESTGKAVDKWYQMDSPATTENIFLTGLTKHEQFSL